jgi:hypothetical protein
MDDLGDRARADKVGQACRWYRANVATIKVLIGDGGLRVPNQSGGGYSLYQENWNPTFWIERWEDKHLSLDDAEVMISGQLRPLFAIVLSKLTNPG